jgi:hypothetical protein
MSGSASPSERLGGEAQHIYRTSAGSSSAAGDYPGLDNLELMILRLRVQMQKRFDAIDAELAEIKKAVER